MPAVPLDRPRDRTGSTAPAAAPMPRMSRWLVTLGAIAFAAVTPFIAAPGIPVSALPLSRPAGGALFSPFAFGAYPLIDAYVFVELAALLVPRWARLRNSGPARRAKLDRVAAMLGALFTLVASLGVVLFLRANLTSGEFPLRLQAVCFASIVGGTYLTIFVAQSVTRRGLMNGFVLIIAAQALRELVVVLADACQQTYALRGWSIALLVFTVAVPFVCTWITGDGASGTATRTNTGLPYRDSSTTLALHPSIPVPASSAYPLVVAALLPALAAFLVSLGIPGSRALAAALSDTTTLFATRAAIVVVLGLALSWLFHREEVMVAFALRLGASLQSARTERGAALRRSLAPTLLFLLAITFAEGIASRLRTPLPNLAVLPFLAAAMRDLTASARQPELVCVWQERRPFAVAAIRARLQADGIASEARGVFALAILQAFGPYAPADVLVAADDAPRATTLLKRLLLGRRMRSDVSRDHVREPDATPAEAPSRVRLAHPVVRVGAVFALVLGVFIATPMLLESGEHGVALRPVALSIVRVADDCDPFASLTIGPDAPRGLSIFTEHLPTGLDARGQKRTTVRSYARLALQDGETVDALVSRARPWFEAHVHLPDGVRLAFEEIRDPDTSTVEGVRSVLLNGDALVTSADVMSASAAIDELQPSRYQLTVVLTHDGEERFRLASSTAANREIAILLDGRIDSTPVLLGEVPGGRLSVATGASEKLADGDRLARALTREPLERRAP
jgi:hypothetical protein